MVQDLVQPSVSKATQTVPRHIRSYLDHAHQGMSLRQIAQREGVHASTVLRHIRRVEGARDDPLCDAALTQLERVPCPQKVAVMTSNLDPQILHVLRRLGETGALLARAADLEKAAVLREGPDGVNIRTCVVDQAVAEHLVVQDWIECIRPGRVASYRITTAGRAALRRLSEPSETPFGDQHRVWGEKPNPEEPARRIRYNMAESPVVSLGRRRDKEGVPYLTPEQVAAGERLREDFELAQMGPRIAQNWERFLTGPSKGGFGGSHWGGGAQGAMERVRAALADLGPGLGDMALRCCCHLEGLEAAERELGWAARSGKVVLRIALDRLRRHYEQTYGGRSAVIG